MSELARMIASLCVGAEGGFIVGAWFANHHRSFANLPRKEAILKDASTRELLGFDDGDEWERASQTRNLRVMSSLSGLGRKGW